MLRSTPVRRCTRLGAGTGCLAGRERSVVRSKVDACRESVAAVFPRAVAIAALLLCATAARAGALATPSPAPQPGPTGLPDGRLYEEVTPAYKNGNFYDTVSELTFGLASADGDAVLYPMSGAVSSATAGLDTEYVSSYLPRK